MKQCEYCKKEFVRQKNESAKYFKERRFCSTSCFGKIHSKNMTGRKLTKEHIEKIKATKKIRNFSQKGNKSSKETIEKMRQAHSGKRASPETKRKMSLARLEKPSSIKETIRVNPKQQYKKKLWFNNRWRALKTNNGGTHTFGEWELLKTQYNWTCPCCKRQNIEPTEDHIVPLIKGGSDNIENIQPLCKSCNCKKHTNIIKY